MAVKHNALTFLLKQFTGLMTAESKLGPEDRKLHQFQLLCQHGKTKYIIVKGGANTVGWKRNDEEMQYVTPIEMLELLTKWSSVKYDYYVAVSASKKLLAKKTTDIRELLQLRPKTSAFIVGVDAAGTKTRLHEWKTGVFNADWIKLKVTK